jgi:hypothetical protein
MNKAMPSKPYVVKMLCSGLAEFMW